MADLYSLHRLTIAAPGEPLFAALAAAIPGLSRHKARLAITAGLVKIAGAMVLEPKTPLDASSKVECDLRHGIKAAFKARVYESLPPMAKPFDIVYQDSQVVVVDKAAGLVSAPTHKPGIGTPERGHVPELLRRVFRKRGQDIRFLGVVHRLDKETSGCLAIALSREAQRLLSAQFASHAAARTYRCLTVRTPRTKEDTLRGVMGRRPDGKRTLVKSEPRENDRGSDRGHDDDADSDDRDHDGKEMITHFRVLRSFKDKDGRDLGAELEVRLETGRTHQIRVSLAAIGCPVYGDHVYGLIGRAAKDAPLTPKPPRMMLHAHLLAFDHPITGDRVEVVAPIPPVFDEFARLLT
ncbi:MAG: RluA family pseudouridine synthase [Planctomycetes bacterium]|nr:RluA family pseudouridine synthase [Planctomycetota bacterium]